MTFKQEKGKVIARANIGPSCRIVFHEKTSPVLVNMLASSSEKMKNEKDERNEEKDREFA